MGLYMWKPIPQAQQEVMKVLAGNCQSCIAQFQASRKAEGAALQRYLADSLMQMDVLISPSARHIRGPRRTL